MPRRSPRLATYVYLHLRISAIVHDQAVRQSYAVRLHGMASDICVVSDIRIVEVRDSLLATWAVCPWRVERGEGS